MQDACFTDTTQMYMLADHFRGSSEEPRGGSKPIQDPLVGLAEVYRWPALQRLM